VPYNFTRTDLLYNLTQIKPESSWGKTWAQLSKKQPAPLAPLSKDNPRAPIVPVFTSDILWIGVGRPGGDYGEKIANVYTIPRSKDAPDVIKDVLLFSPKSNYDLTLDLYERGLLLAELSLRNNNNSAILGKICVNPQAVEYYEEYKADGHIKFDSETPATVFGGTVIGFIGGSALVVGEDVSVVEARFKKASQVAASIVESSGHRAEYKGDVQPFLPPNTQRIKTAGSPSP
jgi:hypothetical protein